MNTSIEMTAPLYRGLREWRRRQYCVLWVST